MSWNILAHEFTGFEAKNHLNKADGKHSAREHVDQLVQRCERARRQRGGGGEPCVVARGGIDVLVLNAGRFVLGSPTPVPPLAG
jgi:NAD(P)-dependent dehydrogenase (short-subunit alcohol dehydrogenase family)